MPLGRSTSPDLLHTLAPGAQQALCGAACVETDTAGRDDLLCGACLDRIERQEQPFGVDVAFALETVLQKRLAAMPYSDYLRTAHWQRTRAAAIDLYGSSCVLCGGIPVDVHHRTYERRGRERLDDLIVLCHACHTRHHDEAA